VAHDVRLFSSLAEWDQPALSSAASRAPAQADRWGE
jgi:hypothetical protein